MSATLESDTKTKIDAVVKQLKRKRKECESEIGAISKKEEKEEKEVKLLIDGEIEELKRKIEEVKNKHDKDKSKHLKVNLERKKKCEFELGKCDKKLRKLRILNEVYSRASEPDQSKRWVVVLDGDEVYSDEDNSDEDNDNKENDNKENDNKNNDNKDSKENITANIGESKIALADVCPIKSGELCAGDKKDGKCGVAKSGLQSTSPSEDSGESSSEEDEEEKKVKSKITFELNEKNLTELLPSRDHDKVIRIGDKVIRGKAIKSDGETIRSNVKIINDGGKVINDGDEIIKSKIIRIPGRLIAKTCSRHPMDTENAYMGHYDYDSNDWEIDEEDLEVSFVSTKSKTLNEERIEVDSESQPILFEDIEELNMEAFDNKVKETGGDGDHKGWYVYGEIAYTYPISLYCVMEKMQ